MDKKNKNINTHDASQPYGAYAEYFQEELGKLDAILTVAFPDSVDDSVAWELKGSFEEKTRMIEERLRVSPEERDSFPLYRLFRYLLSSEAQRAAFLLALAPYAERKYEKLYTGLHGLMPTGLPTRTFVSAVFKILKYDSSEVNRIFSEEAPLSLWNLVTFSEAHEKGVVHRFYYINFTQSDYLLGNKRQLLTEHHTVFSSEPCVPVEELHTAEETLNHLKKVKASLVQKKISSGWFVFSGEGGAIKKSSAIALAKEISVDLIFADMGLLLGASGLDWKKMRRLICDAIISGAAIYFDISANEAFEKGLFDTLLQALQKITPECPMIMFFSVPSESVIPRPLIHEFYHINFSVPGFKIRKNIWSARSGKIAGFSEKEIREFANRFHFTQDQIDGAVEFASKRAIFSEDGNAGMDDLLEACRVQSNGKLSSMGKCLDTPYSRGDIILPEQHYEQLSDLIIQYQYQYQVYHEWGFDKKVAYGRGITVLFSGPSGTGKTMAAAVVGNELKLHVYKIDLSSVISKYIGETEKNLSRIFHEASSSNAILFFDEADAIFGKRTEVKDSHDRYANIEVSYLLQKMEEYEGITVLASNLRQNIDEAFFRRMQFVLEFPFPDIAYREKIWEKIFPDGAPRSSDIDYTFLAEKLEVTGGNIKNMALSAAFIAAGEEKPIGMRHLILAAKKEYKKLNKSFVKSEFAPYYESILEPVTRKEK